MALTLPATSVCVALNTHTLLAAKAVPLAVSMAQAPLALAVVLKVWVLPSVALAVKAMLAQASAPAPVIVGGSLTLAAGAVMTGVATLVSTVRPKGAEVLLAVTSVAVMLCSVPPALLVKALLGVKRHTPVLASAVAVPSTLVMPLTVSLICTLPPKVRATPVRVGLAWLVMLSPKVPLSKPLARVGKAMAVLSMAKV